MNVCSVCGADLEDGCYAGEEWEPTEDAPLMTLPILDSWWLGEFDPYCVDCAIKRDGQIWEAMAHALVGLAALSSGIRSVYNKATQEKPT